VQSGGSSKKVPDLNCEVQDLLLEVVDLKQEVPDLRSGGIPPPNLTPASPSCPSVWVVSERVCVCVGGRVTLQAPEVLMSLPYDARADLWSIATIMYQCLTGRAPFLASSPAQLKQIYERDSTLHPRPVSLLLCSVLQPSSIRRLATLTFHRRKFCISSL